MVWEEAYPNGMFCQSMLLQFRVHLDLKQNLNCIGQFDNERL